MTLLGIVLGGVITRFIAVEWVSRGVEVGFIGNGVLKLFGKF